jgi:hypothetical protein
MKAGRTAPKLPLSRRTLDIRKILPLLDDRSKTHEVSKVRKDKASRPALDAEEVIVLLSLNAKA